MCVKKQSAAVPAPITSREPTKSISIKPGVPFLLPHAEDVRPGMLDQSVYDCTELRSHGSIIRSSYIFILGLILEINSDILIA
jgi:hypothetical protein